MTGFDKLVADVFNSDYQQFNISLLTSSLKNNPSDDLSHLLPEFHKIAIKSFNKNYFIESVFLLAYCYNAGYNRAEIYNFIIKNYYQPFINYYEETYNNNIKSFINYDYIYRKEYPSFSDLDYLFIPIDLNIKKIDEGYIKYSKKKDMFETAPSFTIKIEKSENYAEKLSGIRVLLYNIYDTNVIKWICDNAQCKVSFALKTPNYLYYDSFEEFIEFLQIIDFRDCLNIKKSVFLFGIQELETFLIQPEVLCSESIIYNATHLQSVQNFNLILTSIFEKKNKIYDDMLNKLNKYYSTLTPNIIREKILDKSARISLIASKCTTAVQYYARDCVEAFKKLGYNSILITETTEISSTSGSNKYEMVDSLLKHKPDIVMIIDHFRWEWPVIPKELVFICWIMDHLPHLFDINSAAKTTNLDFILSLYYGHVSFKKIGYPEKQLLPGPLPANPYIYHKYELSEDECAQYSCDICIISNSGNAMETMNKAIFENYSNRPDYEFVKKIKTVYTDIYNIIFDSIYNEKKHYYHEETFKLFKEYFIERTKIVSQIEEIDKIVFEFWGNVITCIYKDTAILWLHEKGYNIKLWGRAWPSHPILKKYAMGVAPNGEIMSKILNASKISIGLTPNVTLHPRVAESLLSECLYMGNDIPLGEDWCNARKYLTPGKEIILFKNKKDLYKKVDYYLENARERESVISCGRKKVLETLTYEIIMQKTLDGIVKRLSELS